MLKKISQVSEFLRSLRKGSRSLVTLRWSPRFIKVERYRETIYAFNANDLTFIDQPLKIDLEWKTKDEARMRAMTYYYFGQQPPEKDIFKNLP